MTWTRYFDHRKRILRRLIWAKLQRGQPVLMEAVHRAGQDLPTDDGRAKTLWPDTSQTADVPKN